MNGRTYRSYVSGECFINDLVIQHKLHLILGDSRQCSLKHLRDSMDLVFVDGGHSSDVVKSDTEKALLMICRGMVW